MGSSNSTPKDNKTYTQDEIKNNIIKLFVITPVENCNTSSALFFDSMKGGSVINNIINNNQHNNEQTSSCISYLMGGGNLSENSNSTCSGLQNIKNGIINLNGGKYR